MKKCLLFLPLFFVKIAFSQVNDAFDDGDFSSGPAWTGSNSGNDFVIVSNQLRSNSTTASSNFYLSTTNAIANDCVWEFWCNLKFATSGANYVDVYLTSNQANLQATNINGYFVRIGNTNDEICLYKRSGASSTSVKLIDGADAAVSTNDNIIKIKVTRTGANLFTLERDMSGTGAAYVSEGSVVDATFNTSAFFGFLIQQSTATFFQKHFFDNIKIQSTAPPDITPPQLSSTKAVDEFTLEVTFNEPLDNTSATILTNYSLNNGYGNPTAITATADPATYQLKYPSGLVTASYTLTASHVKDLSNNAITENNTAVFYYKKPYIPKKGDLIINEIFADPSPQVDLPGVEFVELFNTSNETLYLNNWKYKDATSTVTLLADSILSGQFLILCAKADTNEYKPLGKTIGVSPWPSLNNTGDVLTLISPQNLTIDSVAYRDTWYKNPEKKAGGWALERIAEKPICAGIQNWNASNDTSGGTPGKKNSVFENTSTSPLQLSHAMLSDSITLTLRFNKAIDSLLATDINHYNVNNGLGKPVAALPKSPNFEQVDLKFSAIGRGKNYTITVTGLTDCSGGIIGVTGNSKEFIYPEKILKGNILINEILFNPRSNGVDFLEIYNASDHVLDLKDLLIASTTEKDSLSSIKLITPEQYLFEPKKYLVLTTNPDNIKQEYRSEGAFLKMAALPSFNDDAGVVVLVAENTRIDQLNYTEKMHFPLIKDTEGVSLERSRFKSPTNESGNFRSAAASVGYATPGYINSQAEEDLSANEEIQLTSNTFSPDNDGFEDVLTINYHLAESGTVANLSIFNDQGTLIRRLVKNSTLATEGTIVWDGLNERNEKAALGIYVVYIELFGLNGRVKKYRKNFVLAGKLN